MSSLSRLLLLALFLLPAPAAAAPAREPPVVRVRILTSLGPILLALDTKRAPRTTANFLAYVDDGRLDGTIFYRAARRASFPKYGFVQGGIQTDARRMLAPVPLEPTDRTGLKHVDGAISMAHGANYDGATGNFSIMVGDNPFLDARPGNRGFAAFGRVIGGMAVVKRILAMPTGGGTGPSGQRSCWVAARRLPSRRRIGRPGGSRRAAG